MQSQESYPSDLTDLEWELIEPLLPGSQKLGRPARYEKRAILNAIFYVVRSGRSWRMLPRDLPPYVWKLLNAAMALVAFMSNPKAGSSNVLVPG